ncbi:MAG: DUF4272 domain-containing protein [Chloroflexota bacterium]
MSQLRIQNARAVAYRALCLGALLKRGALEVIIQDVDQWVVFDEVREQVIKKQHQLNTDLNQWLIDENIQSHLSETEQHLLARPLGSWTERTLMTVGWRTEALGTMLWALGRFDAMLAYDTQFETDDVLDPLDILNPTIDFIWLADLRPERELSAAREQAELWNWRSRARELQRMGVRPPEGVSFNDIIRFTAERAYSNGHLPQPINGDFPAFNKSYTKLNPDEYALMSAIAYERNSAMSWICEVTSQWESIRIDYR